MREDVDDAPDYERDPFEDFEPDPEVYEERKAEEAWAATPALARVLILARSRLYWWRYWRRRRRHPERYPQQEAPF